MVFKLSNVVFSYIMLINVIMPTLVGILTFMSPFQAQMSIKTSFTTLVPGRLKGQILACFTGSYFRFD